MTLIFTMTSLKTTGRTLIIKNGSLSNVMTRKKMRKLSILFDPEHDNTITETLLLMMLLVAGGLVGAIVTSLVLYMLGVL